MWLFVLAGAAALSIVSKLANGSFNPLVMIPGKKVDALPAPPLAHDTFTSPTKIQVGDIVTVSAASAEPVENETELGAAAPPNAPSPNFTVADFTSMGEMDRRGKTGEVASFRVTATGLLGKPTIPGPGPLGGLVAQVNPAANQPMSIGVLVEPALSFRLPVAFLDASVRSVTRNGKQVG